MSLLLLFRPRHRDGGVGEGHGSYPVVYSKETYEVIDAERRRKYAKPEVVHEPVPVTIEEPKRLSPDQLQHLALKLAPALSIPDIDLIRALQGLKSALQNEIARLLDEERQREAQARALTEIVNFLAAEAQIEAEEFLLLCLLL